MVSKVPPKNLRVCQIPEFREHFAVYSAYVRRPTSGNDDRCIVLDHYGSAQSHQMFCSLLKQRTVQNSSYILKLIEPMSDQAAQNDIDFRSPYIWLEDTHSCDVASYLCQHPSRWQIDNFIFCTESRI